MNEYTIGYTAVGSLFGLALRCLCYMWGGRSGKWKRRFVGSAVIATTVVVASIIMGKFFWTLPLIYIPLALGFSLGYGGDTTEVKVLKRSIVACCVISAGLVCALTFMGNAWWVFLIHCGIGVWSVYLGVKNPVYAAAEEVFVCAVLNLGLIMYPFIS